MSFLETPRFPVTISYGSAGGPGYRVKRTPLLSGVAQKAALWSQALHTYNAAFGVRTLGDLYDLIVFWHALGGSFNEFRYKDWMDYKSCHYNDTPAFTDQSLGSGDGATLAWQLIKLYTSGALSRSRTIKKPVAGTSLFGINNPLTGDVQELSFSVDTTTGIITTNDIQKTITAATSAAVCQLTAASHGLTTGATIYLDIFTGDWAALNGKRYPITYVNANAFTIPVDTTSFTAYSSNGGDLDTVVQTDETPLSGFEFDVPCEFVDEALSVSIDAYKSGSLNVPVREVRL